MKADSKQTHEQRGHKQHGQHKHKESDQRKDGKQHSASAKRASANNTAATKSAHKKKSEAKASGSTKNANSTKIGARLCPYSAQCGGCSCVEVPYKQQLTRKQREMEQLFASVAPNVTVSPILGMEQPFHYRDKVISPYAPGRPLKGAAGQGGITRNDAGTRGNDHNRKGMPGQDSESRSQAGAEHRNNAGGKANARNSKNATGTRREILTGMYERGSHRLIPAEKCLVENETAKQVTLAIRDIMARWNMAPYNEDTGEGFVRHAVVRVGHESGEVLVALVTNEEDFPASRSFCRELVRRVPAVTTVVQNINSRQTNVILGEKERVLYGPGFILDTLCGLSFRISPQSFYQVNSTQTEVLYNTAMEMAQLEPHTWAIDAYCGTGTIGLVAAARGAKRVIGVDSVEIAIADARQNARHNGIGNAEFFAADATAFIEQLARENGEGADADELVIFMDPPRAGSTPQFISAAGRLHPARIVYISCNPSTQVRDLQEFAKHGYRATRIQPVDMFPHTEHVECVVLLEPSS